MTGQPYPTPSSALATKKMRSNRRSDTKPEVALRSLLHGRGLRFRKDYAIRLDDGKIVHADIAFTRKKVAVFVDGCFWHSCPEHATVPKANRDYWVAKLQENSERDVATTRRLGEAGWRVVRLWTHLQMDESGNLVLVALAQD